MTISQETPRVSSLIPSLNQVLVSNSDAVFSYKIFSEPNLLESGLKEAAAANGVFYKSLEARRGAALAPLGYAEESNSRLTTIVVPSYASPDLLSTFAEKYNNNKNFLFSVAALGYDSNNGVISNNYVDAFDTASRLGSVLITPINYKELSTVSKFATVVGKFVDDIKLTTLLYDGTSYTRSQFSTVLEPAQLANIQEPISFQDALTSFNLSEFEYLGDSTPEILFVTYGSLESELFTSVMQQSQTKKIGLISVRIPLPFNYEKFVSLIPSSVKKVVVVSQSRNTNIPSSGLLNDHISIALFRYLKSTGALKLPKIENFSFDTSFVWSTNVVIKIISSFISDFTFNGQQTDSKSYSFWSADNNKLFSTPASLVNSIAESSADLESVIREKYDNVTGSGIYQAQWTVTTNRDLLLPISNLDSVDLSIVTDLHILNYYDITSQLNENGVIVISLPISEDDYKVLDFTKQETFTDVLKIPTTFLTNIKEKSLNLVIVNSNKEALDNDIITKGIFWKYSFNYTVAQSVKLIGATLGDSMIASDIFSVLKEALETDVWEINATAIPLIKKPQDDGSTVQNQDEDLEMKDTYLEAPALLATFNETSFRPNEYHVSNSSGEINQISTSSIAEISKRLTFREAYGTTTELRPDLSMKTFVIKVKENRRVTPEDYDRYIFNIEFDIKGTGLKYDIGEALGIHARNDSAKVNEFLAYYGLDPKEIVLVPNKDDNSILEARTVFQAFVENLDIFGKPPKKFYEALIPFAQDEKDKDKLTNLISPAGASELKVYQDEEFFTYADIFEEFPSVRPAVTDLVSLIAPLKRREYSIASSQKVHPNEIHLLIVVVDWVDKRGRKRFGQASKYISELPVGAELVVSVKPSVMKLPQSPLQPVIMSGLGTGLAPFKAIVEEKMWQKQQGMDIGEVYLFLGSRHKREEYLYGELWEAYKDAGIITHIGAAFSRDQDYKIYIQDRIKEVLSDLKEAMIAKQGTFYLCGPTWPVPDITNALKDIVEMDAKEKGIKIDLAAAIEDLKETSRYILEVY
ncbi:hypothetical protein TBLA_0D04600 [Henningerozyma blattae CBS 6284]|uniref:assimilatory sulfite reductase (NADPH) n=1 Tax=Henningerozyma blattae (strain ATCC 34711 / CBS 6284 / DSM 70876 / NBRC 10599 / NRRL Y-10934 / UCD 77-7) TaxID=1071380 RepID=I2H3K4_HENB6|nr:hypothetical protein TBLA_0D04600 [Tetrapisispora blattae CBS 6284]CCH60956.1 hypothetical protein TBLA_0D04600 [Tetrapisispora blattae CBS 6284]